MVFIGGWRSRRPRRSAGPYRQPFGGYRGGYGGGYGYGPRGGSCMRDMFLMESGCCIAELLGCGPQFLLVAPRALTRGAHRSLRQAGEPRLPLREAILRRLLAAIRMYQREISPRRGPCCRYSPTCSHYAAEALATHGLVRGLGLTARRLLRCRPGAVGGEDPVPPVARVR